MLVDVSCIWTRASAYLKWYIQRQMEYVIESTDLPYIGGLEEWKKAQCPVVSGHVTPEDKSSSFSKKAQESFVATFHSDFVYDAPKVG